MRGKTKNVIVEENKNRRWRRIRIRKRVTIKRQKKQWLGTPV